MQFNLQQFKRFKNVLIFSLIITNIYCFLYYTKNSSKFSSNIAINKADNSEKINLFSSTLLPSSSDNVPIIFEWNTFNGGSTFGEEYIKKCPLKCIYTNDTKFEEFADVLTINFGKSSLKKLPTTRNPKRLNAFISYEPPLHRPFYLKAPKDFFNISVTYRLESHILMLYDFLEPIQHSSEAWDQSEVNAIITQKENPILFFVSHCKTPSKREMIVQKLEHYFNITQYGSCNKKHCWFNETCETQGFKSHYFTLAFENSDCIDYVTEKVYRLRNLIVPIILNRKVLRGIHQRLNPYVIAVSDFNTIEEMVDYLNFLINNKSEYAKYFDWTKFYKKLPSKGLIDDVACSLCEIAWKKKKQRGFRKIIPNIHEWWGKNKCHKDFGETYLKFRNSSFALFD